MRKFTLLPLLLAAVLTLAACGQNTEEILKFQNELNDVIVQIESINNDLNELDVLSPDAAEVALSKLSELNDSFEALAAIKVTDPEHSYISDLTVEGADYMAQSYELFEKAYGLENFDAENAELAYKYLERATTRIRVIVTMLHGEIPEGVVVH